MQTTLNIDGILSQVKRLDKENQQVLLDRLLMLLHREKNESPEQIMLSSITRIGSDIWTNTDIDEYIEKERQW